MRGAPEKDKVGDIVFADVTGALEPVNGEKVDAQLLSGKGMSDGGALVDDENARRFELLDYGAGGIPGGLDDLDALVDHNLRVGIVIRRDHGREEGDIHPEGVGGHLAASPDLLAEVFRGGLREGGEDSCGSRALLACGTRQKKL